MFKFKLINRTATPIDANTIGALATQVLRDFAPTWGPDMEFGGSGQISVPLYVEQNSDVSGALGYHDIDSGGNPYVKVFVADSNAAGVPVSAVMSHEILEVLGDPFVQSLCLKQDMQGPTLLPSGTLFDAEVCDPVEGDLYQINGVSVSNFITPEWFMPASSIPTKYDYLGKLTAPFTMTAGGYYVTTSVGQLGQPQQVLGDKARPWNGSKS